MEVVQIDLTLVSRLKNNQRRTLAERWVFCGVEESPKMCFMQFVPTRAKATLLPIIEQFIRLGTLKITYKLNWQAIDES